MLYEGYKLKTAEDEEEDAREREAIQINEKPSFSGSTGKKWKHNSADRNDAKTRVRRLLWLPAPEAPLDDQQENGHAVADSQHDGDGPTMIDFGAIDDEGLFKDKHIRVKVCGRTIWNYPSEKAMARGGWLQYAVITKGSRFEDAATLCRNWSEFWELLTLTIFNYFPSTAWYTWAGENMRQMQLKMGIISYIVFDQAVELTKHQQPIRIAQGRGYRDIEYKNLTCFYLKRNDPVSRRFVQYLDMMGRWLCVLVRDAKTGKVLEPQPPTKHRWLARERTYQGRLDSGKWTITQSVGEDLFNKLEGMKTKSLQLGFNELYDITVWDTEPGETYAGLYSLINDAMVKAQRICSDPTPYREPETFRVRDALDGEWTLYEKLNEGRHMILRRTLDGRGQREWSEEAPPGYFYNEVDAAEDLVLFPEEAEGRVIAASTERDDILWNEFENARPNFKRFALDLDSDEDSDDYDDPLTEAGRLRIKDDLQRPVKDRLLRIKDVEDEDDDHEWEDELSDEEILMKELNGLALSGPPKNTPPCPYNGEIPDCACGECKWFKQHDHLLAPVAANAKQRFLEKHGHAMFGEQDVDRLYSDNVQRWSLKAFIFDDNHHLNKSRFERDPREEFSTQLDRSKGKAFTKQWHAAEIQPRLSKQWNDTQDMIRDAKTLMLKDVAEVIRAYEVRQWLQVHPSENRRVMRDMWDAMAATLLLFPKQYSEKDDGEIARWSPDQAALRDNLAKAAQEPYERSPLSSTSLPRDFWRDVDKQTKQDYVNCPPEWGIIARPAVAQLFKNAIIEPAHDRHPNGTAVAAALPGKDLDLYIDYRELFKMMTEYSSNGITDPFSVDLLRTARTFAQQHGTARFALLRVQSHRYFYPLMQAGTMKENMGFADTAGRAWQWRFIPKDQPKSELSMQKNVEDRLYGTKVPLIPLRGEPINYLHEDIRRGQGGQRFRKLFDDRMQVRRHIVLVMGKDSKDLQRYVTGAIFALKTKPWRLEVDLWKSFVDVDLEFLEKLDKKWLE